MPTALLEVAATDGTKAPYPQPSVGALLLLAILVYLGCTFSLRLLSTPRIRNRAGRAILIPIYLGTVAYLIYGGVYHQEYWKHSGGMADVYVPLLALHYLVPLSLYTLIAGLLTLLLPAKRGEDGEGSCSSEGKRS